MRVQVPLWPLKEKEISMGNKPWRMIETVLTSTCGPERGPNTPIGGIKSGLSNTYLIDQFPHGNRGDRSGSECFGWRNHLGKFTWEDGKAPAKCGVICDDNWNPIPVKDLDDLHKPFGGFPRSVIQAQKAAEKS